VGTQREKVILEGEDRTRAAMKSAESGFEKFAGTVTKAAVAGGLFIGAQQIIRLAQESLKAAVAAEEAASAFNTTFGPATQRVSRFVDEFANKAGFARHELQQMLAITGNVVQGIGATEDEAAALAEQMAILAGDVASFSNAQGGAQAVMAALQSAINGEREALKTYGLALAETEVTEKALQMTQKGSVDQLTRLDTALATIELAYEKAGKAVGDLDRTQDSAANALRRTTALWHEAQVEIGQALLPTLQALLPILIQLAPTVGSVLAAAFGILGDVVSLLAPPLQLFADILGLITPLLNPFTVAIGAAALGVTAFVRGFDPLSGGGLFPKISGGFAKLTAAINPWTVALGGAVAVFAIWQDKSRENEERARAFAETLDTQTAALTENTTAFIENALVKDDDLLLLKELGFTTEDFIAALDKESDAYRALTGAVKEYRDEAFLAQDTGELKRANDLIAKIKEMVRARREATSAVKREADADRALTAAQERATLSHAEQRIAMLGSTEAIWGRIPVAAAATAATRELTDAEREAIADAHRLALETRTLTGELETAAAAQQNLADVLLAAADPLFGAISAYEQYEEALARASALQADETATAEDLARAQADIAQAALRAQAALSALDGTEGAKAVEAFAAALKVPREEAEAILTTLGIISGTRWTTVIDIEALFTERYTSPGSSKGASFRMHAGGQVPSVAGGGDLWTLLRPGEWVLTREDFESLAAESAMGRLSPSEAPTMPSLDLSGRLVIEVPVHIDGRKVARATGSRTVKEVVDRIGGYRRS
jgi:hypothetical protein